MLRLTLTSLALVCAFVLSACSDSTMPTSPDETDLSGTNLQAAKLAGAGSVTGEVGGAQYYIEVPENWNGDLVLFAHGYIGPDVPIEAIDPATIEGGKRDRYCNVATHGRFRHDPTTALPFKRA